MPRSGFRTYCAALVVNGLLGVAGAAAQTPTIGSVFPAEVLRDLPAGANLFAILETTQADVVADRFNSGGLNVSEPARLGGFLGSWSQTQYRVGDAVISSPFDGTPLMFPEVSLWQRLQITTGLMPVEINAPGLAVAVEPYGRLAGWTRTVEAVVGPEWHHVDASAAGPRAVIGGSWSRNADGERGSAHASAVFAPRPRYELRTFAWVQRLEAGTTHSEAVHVQSTVEQVPSRLTGWRAFGAFTQRHRLAETLPTGIVVDRLVDGPIPLLVDHVDRTERRWTAGVRRGWFGVEWDRTSSRGLQPFTGTIEERVNGLPSRVWEYSARDQASSRHATSLAGFVKHRFTPASNVMLDAALRVETVSGRARGASGGIRWWSALPSVRLQWHLGTPYVLTFFTGAGRTANQLLLSLLAIGDPAAPVANVFRWDGPLVARVPTGTIDPDLKRSYTDEFAIGLESRPRSTLRLAVTGIARRQTQLVNVINVGVPSSSYTAFTIPDANADLVGGADDQDLVIYNRLPESFGRDEYLLTNPGQDNATMGAFIVTAQASTTRLFLLISATAAAAVGSGANRSFRATENDQDILGELFTNPNASTYARGRLFSDRAYTIKWTTVYRLPYDLRLGAIARYQDGQPFTRLVVVPDLNQGAEAVQAFARGRSRFAFTGTLDVRVQKGFAIATNRVDVLVDAYNLLNMRKETEEYVVTGERFRKPTAVQPARVFHVGVRVRF